MGAQRWKLGKGAEEALARCWTSRVEVTVNHTGELFFNFYEEAYPVKESEQSKVQQEDGRKYSTPQQGQDLSKKFR